MGIQYNHFAGLPPEPLLSATLTLLTGVFANQSPADTSAELTYYSGFPAMQTWLAVADGRVVGCKLGYERKPTQFYSWLGCVDAAWRGRGIASALMQQQHDWCRQGGYQTIQTQTYNQWRSMLVLNIRAGFNIIGTAQGKHGLTILLEKKWA